MTTLQAISNLLIYRPEKLEILHSDVGLIEKKHPLTDSLHKRMHTRKRCSGKHRIEGSYRAIHQAKQKPSPQASRMRDKMSRDAPSIPTVSICLHYITKTQLISGKFVMKHS